MFDSRKPLKAKLLSRRKKKRKEKEKVIIK